LILDKKTIINGRLLLVEENESNLAAIPDWSENALK